MGVAMAVTGFAQPRLCLLQLILQHALGRRIYIYIYMYVCPSRSSTHAREDGGGVTRVRVAR